MIFVTGLFIYHTKLVFKNITTKEDIKSFWDNSQGNPYMRNKKLNYKNSLFPQKQKYSLIDIFKKGFMNIIPLKDDERSDIQNSSSKEQKDKVENNLTFNNVNNINNNQKTDNNNMDNKERNISTTVIIENKENNKQVLECSNFIVDEKINNKKNISYIQTGDIKIDLTDEKILKRRINKTNINIKERYSDSNNSEVGNNIRRSTVRVSDCSENITDASAERKVPYFQTNFDTESHNNIEERLNENNNKNINMNE